MHLRLVGLNHETAPLAVRERVALRSGEIVESLRRLKASGLPEVAMLSTCNRMEIYALLPTSDPEPLVAFMEETAGGDESIAPHLYLREEATAARHLMRVACGLNSLVLGEGQILSQVKAAFQQASEAGTVGGHLSALFRHALAAGKRARSETGIARGAVSISNAAVQLARELFGDLKNDSVLVLGAGETAELTLRLLSESGVRSVIVANRTYANALALAESLGGSAIQFDELETAMAGADIVIGSTAAPHPIIRRDMAARVMRKRRNRPLFLIDIAVPRDVEPSVGDLPNLFLYNIDDLKQVVDESLETRAAEGAKAEEIVEEELKRLLDGWRGLSLGPILKALQTNFEEIRRTEMEKSGRRLSNLTEGEREAVDLLTRGIIKRILKEPIAQLKLLGDSPESALQMEALRYLFALDSSRDSSFPDEDDADDEAAKNGRVDDEAARNGLSPNGSGRRKELLDAERNYPLSLIETPKDPSHEAKVGS